MVFAHQFCNSSGWKQMLNVKQEYTGDMDSWAKDTNVQAKTVHRE